MGDISKTRPIVIGPLGVALRLTSYPGDLQRARAKVGRCQQCGEPRVTAVRCETCRVEHVKGETWRQKNRSY